MEYGPTPTTDHPDPIAHGPYHAITPPRVHSNNPPTWATATPPLRHVRFVDFSRKWFWTLRSTWILFSAFGAQLRNFMSRWNWIRPASLGSAGRFFVWFTLMGSNEPWQPVAYQWLLIQSQGCRPSDGRGRIRRCNQIRRTYSKTFL